MAALRDYHSWLLEVVRFYRSLEFFQDGKFAGTTDVECARLIEGDYAAWYRRRYEEECAKDGVVGFWQLESCVLATDINRVWKVDSEGVYEIDQFYLNALKSLGRISRNTFYPQSIREQWRRDEEPTGTSFDIHLSFDEDNRTHRIWILGGGDFANAGFLAAVNGIMSGRGQRFQLFSEDQDWLVVSQTDAEAAAMVSRGFSLFDTESRTGVIEYPILRRNRTPQKCERLLYADRGIYRHSLGDAKGAWEDIRVATEFGVNDLYSKIKDQEPD